MSTTTADGLHYVATSNDSHMMGQMYTQRKTWSEYEMNLFYTLAQLFYKVNSNDGWFLDLGANIGTTGIYFLKKLTPNLKLLAFEPDPENFKLLRTNLILNDIEENSITENYGLGEVESEMTMYRNLNNPGNNGMFSAYAGGDSETIKIISLDKYFVENHLNAKDVKYIWIDTEGFEAQVLLGMKNILAENPAPIFMEFNPKLWQKAGVYEDMVHLLVGLYEGYVWIKRSVIIEEVNVDPIETLWQFQNSKDGFGVLGDIFLIHEVKK